MVLMQISQPSSLATAASAAVTASANGNDTEQGKNYVNVLCCMCGIPIAPNAVNTCATCLASQSDITRGISTETTLHQCRGCQRWHKEAAKWIACELESRELMALCISHVNGLRHNTNNSANKIRLVDASWIWTEPHSMRLKVRLTIQRQTVGNIILQQSFVVVFIVRNQQCVECQSVFRQGSWKSLVQVRQRVAHKRTFLYLEQLILKHGAHRGCLSLEAFKDGMDFYFPDKNKAARFISFLESVCPTRVKTSKKLISTDDKNNVVNFKYTNYVELCPLCKDDLMFLPHKTARQMGDLPRLVLVKGISNLIHFIDPLSGQIGSMNSDTFWRQPLRPLITAARSRLTRYVVLGKEPLLLRQNASQRKTNRKQTTRLASLTLAREDDLGKNDTQFEMVRSHVGYLLKAGDVVLGFDLLDTQFVDEDAEALREKGTLPPVVVVRKLYGAAAAAGGDIARNSKRIWKLQRLDVDVADSSGTAAEAGEFGATKTSKKKDAAAAEAKEMDEEDFMQEIEADKEMRTNVNLYKAELALKKEKNKLQQTETGVAAMDEENDNDGDEDDDEDDDQKIKLDELMDGLALDVGPDDETTNNAVGNIPDSASATTATTSTLTISGPIGFIGREEARTMRAKDAAVAVVVGDGNISKDLLDGSDL